MAERSGASASRDGEGRARRRVSRDEAEARRNRASAQPSTRRRAASHGASTARSTQGAQRRTGSSAASHRGSTQAQGEGRRVSNAARARRARAYREAQRRRRNRRLALLIAGALASVLVLFFVVRGVTGCVSKVFAPKKAEETTQQISEEVIEEASAPTQIDLVMIGDILQHSGVFQSGFMADGSRNYDHVFAHIGSEIEGADIKVVNQETLLGGESFGFSGYPTFNGPQEMGDAEVKAGFNVVLRATNHAMDMGYAGLSSEISYWRNSHPEVAVIGAVDPNDESTSIEDVYVFEKDGFKVALLNYTYDLNGFEDPQGAVSTLDEEHVRRTVTAANEMADMVVVFPHWGEEYNLVPVQSQYDMAQIFMDCGADVIIGGHPHVIEPVEILTASDGRKVPCFWSVGNFICTQVDNENLIGGVAKVSLVKDPDGTCSVTACSFVPTVCHKGEGANMTTYLLSDYTDELASTNYLAMNDTDNTSLTRAWANDFCTQVLGSGFDTSSERISFSQDALTSSQPSQTDVQQDAEEESAELDEAA